MDLVTGAMGSVLQKLSLLLKDEYELQTGVKKKIRSLSKDLESMHAVLLKVAEVPPDQLDEEAKLWKRDVRELSYNVEDILDTFLVHVEGGEAPDPNRFKRAAKKISKLFNKVKARHQIGGMIKTIEEQAEVVAKRHRRYRAEDIVANIVAKPAAASAVDPRLEAMYKEVSQLVGIDKSSAELVAMLSSSQQDDASSNRKMKIVSVVGVGGLGKTTLAKAVYDELKHQFDCGAFVPVGRNPDLKKVFREILIDLDKEKYMDIKFTMLDERLLINELNDFLRSKRYLIVIDDIWETESWKTLKLALVESSNGSRIITTTRKEELATDGVYKLQKLSYDNSKKLFYTRIFDGKDNCPCHQPDEVSDKILKKCDGVPLAIITMASLLVGKSREAWPEICSSIGFGQKENQQVENTMKILSFSYYDLPSHLRSCLLYLSAFPEDYLIEKDPLIWKWIAEGFVHGKSRIRLFEVGEGYFNDLINRCMIQAEISEYDGIIYGCRVHDMVLDLIRSMSHEENFITILDSDKFTLSGNNARRLALQNRTMEYTIDDNHVNIPQVRSFIASKCDIDKGVPFPSFKLLRVLALENCNMEGGYHLKHLEKLLHLRYLSLMDTNIGELPKGIGALKLLQTLDLQGTDIEEFPSSIGLLTQLVCLRAQRVSLPTGTMEKLTSLEELAIGWPAGHKSGEQLVKDLGNLSEIRVLEIYYSHMDKGMQSDFLQSLENLHKMQRLIFIGGTFETRDLDKAAWDAAVLPRHLQYLIVPEIKFDSLPSFINASSLPHLSHLSLYVCSLDEQGLRILGFGLPELRCLELATVSTVTLTNIAADGCFQKLRFCRFEYSMGWFVLNEDTSVSFTISSRNDDAMAFGYYKKEDKYRVSPAVMPNLQRLEFVVPLQKLMDNSCSCGNLGLEYLPSLQKVGVYLRCEGVSTDFLEKEEAALRHAIEVHPNRPTLQIRRWGKPKMIVPSEPVALPEDDDLATKEQKEEITSTGAGDATTTKSSGGGGGLNANN